MRKKFAAVKTIKYVTTQILGPQIFDASIWNSLNVVRVVVLHPSAHATLHVEGGIVGVCISDL